MTTSTRTASTTLTTSPRLFSTQDITSPQPLSALWWNTNAPPSEQTPACPSYLTYAAHHPKELANLSTPDSLFIRKTWPEVRSLIAANRLDQFTRVPSELRQYRRWTERVVKQYGSMLRFIVEERLGWGGEVGLGVANGGRFGCKEKETYKILPNDWPYGLDTRIVHLVVWTKFSFPSDPLTDDLLPASRAEIEDFVSDTFSRVCGEDNVVWFRNWGDLKSVRAIEHFHVLLFDPPEGFVSRITEG